MTWQLHVPYRDRGDSLLDVLDLAGEIADREDCAITRSLVMDAFLEGRLETAGELIDKIEAASPGERREMLNRARVESGLDTVEDVLATRRFEAAERARRPRPPMRCAVCGVQPLTSTGMPDPNIRAVKRWHCPEHAAQAEPGDLDPLPSGIGLDMRPVPDPDEVEREQRRDEQHAEAQRRRREERELRGREAREVRRLHEEQFARELFGGRS